MTEPTAVQAALDDAGYRLTGRAARSPTHRRAGTGRSPPPTWSRTPGTAASASVARRSSGRSTSLAELDAVERLDLPTGEHAYVACEPIHHHHVVCSSCGREPRRRRRGLAGGRPRHRPPDRLPDRRSPARAVRPSARPVVGSRSTDAGRRGRRPGRLVRGLRCRHWSAAGWPSVRCAMSGSSSPSVPASGSGRRSSTSSPSRSRISDRSIRRWSDRRSAS